MGRFPNVTRLVTPGSKNCEPRGTAPRCYPPSVNERRIQKSHPAPALPCPNHADAGMKSGVPWQVKGVRRQARETAREAARRSGMSVGEWLDSVIIDSALDEGVEPPHDRDAREQHLRGIPARDVELRQPDDDRRPPPTRRR